MSRRLVQVRSRRNDASSTSTPVRSRNREDDSSILELPPYEPPSCVLSAKARLELNKLKDSEDDVRKYRKHLEYAQKTIPNAVAQLNDKANKRKQANEKWIAKRIEEGRAEDEKTEAERGEEHAAAIMAKTSEELTEESEIALREIIDYGDELSMRTQILTNVIESIAVIPPPQLDSLEQEEEDEQQEGAPDVISTVEILERAKEDYAETYRSQSMYKRYADNIATYSNFKSLLHDSLYGDTIEIPISKAWFHGDKPDIFYGSGTRMNDAVDDENESNEDNEDDDEVIIAGSKPEYKCPLTMRVFENPCTSKVCRHTYEKQAILELIDGGTVFGGRGGPKQVQCPQVGCFKMLKHADLVDDELMRRKVKRHLEQAAYDDQDEDEDEDMEEEEQPSQRQQKSQVKRE